MTRGVIVSRCAVVIFALAAGAVRAAPDTYDFLIPQFGKKAVEWSAKQTQLTRQKAEASPNYAAVLADMKALQADDGPLPSYYLLGDRGFLRVERSRLHPFGRIAIANARPDGRPGAWRTALDLDAYNQGRSVPYTMKWINPEQECRFPDYDRCMISLFPAGGQGNVIVELDVATGTFVENGFRLAPGRNFVSWLDGDTLLVAHTTDGAPALASQFPAELKVWKRGTPIAQARTIFRVQPEDSLFEFRVVGPAEKRRIFVNVSKTYSRFQVKEVALNGRVSDFPFPEALNNFGTPQISGRHLAVQLDEAAKIREQHYPADSIVAYDLETKQVSAVMTPPKGVYLTGGFAATQAGFVIVGVRGLQRIVYLATPAAPGWAVRELLTEESGLTVQVAAHDRSGTLLLREEGFLTPPRYALLSRTSTTVIDAARPLADMSGYTVDIRSARSKDGTLVDYYLLHESGSQKGPTPTIVEGYGSFGISDDPEYFCCRLRTSWKTWFDRGGAFAVAAIRGGGERGGAWHRDATGIHKIRSFEDFIAVAEDLHRSGFTDTGHLGALGYSAGGLLVAGAVVMRPDLYGAVLVGAPLTDNSIIGHGDGGIGAGMTSEVGDWSNPVELAFMQVWDPYANVRAGVFYPPTLTIVATTDSQVGPSHARRFVAKMQEVGAPALLLEGSEGGHDYPDPFTQTADAAMQMSFFIDQLMKNP